MQPCSGPTLPTRPCPSACISVAPVDTAHTRWGCFPAQVKGPLTPTGSRHAGGGRHSGPRRRGFAAPRVPIRPGSLPGYQVGIPSLWTDSHCDGEAATALRGPLHTHVQKEREESGAPRNPEGQLRGSEGPVGGMDRLAVTGAGGRRCPGVITCSSLPSRRCSAGSWAPGCPQGRHAVLPATFPSNSVGE